MKQTVVNLVEWQEASPDTEPLLRAVTLPQEPRVRRLLESLARQPMLSVVERRDGLSVAATSFVGSLSLGPVTIRVRPKIDSGLFAALVSYGFHLHRVQLFQDHVAELAKPAFQDLIVRRLCDEVVRLMGRGLVRGYRPIGESLPTPRGRIEFDVLARQSGGYSTLPCRHFVRTDNQLHNRVLLSGLLSAAAICADVITRNRALRLAGQLRTSVSPVRLSRSTFAKVERISTRLTDAYEPALALIRLIVAGQGVALGHGGEIARLPGFLLNMDLLFQEVIGRFLHDWVAGATLEQQYRLRAVFSYDATHNPRNRRTPTPRPDFVVRLGSRILAILDAKYRDLWEKPLPPEMLYQLTVYALSTAGCTTATILFPTTFEHAREARICIRDPVSGLPRGRVVLRPVHLRTLAKLVVAPRTVANDRERHRFASHLVFGEEESAGGRFLGP